MYKDWGFRHTPFDTRALRPTWRDADLLVGRTAEMAEIEQKIRNPPKVVLVEGANGVGKTSLVNIAAFKMYSGYLNKQNDYLIIPCSTAFQVSSGSSPEILQEQVARAIAKELVARKKDLENKGITPPSTRAMEKWLNSPFFESGSGSIGGGIPGIFSASIGGGAGRSSNPNFSIVDQVFGWLEEIFPDDGDGAVLCVIDNLELIETSNDAKDLVEQIRDPLLMRPGLRWVLCGASGATLTLPSPRLSGLLHDVIDIRGISAVEAKRVLETRVASLGEQDAYLPLAGDAFEELYIVLNRNLRESLSFADRYCEWAHSSGRRPMTNDHRAECFREWLDGRLADEKARVESKLRGKALEVFATAVEMGGSFSPGDYEDFGYDSNQALRPQVRKLEELQLLAAKRDDDDKRRKTIAVTPRGWLVARAFELESAAT